MCAAISQQFMCLRKHLYDIGTDKLELSRIYDAGLMDQARLSRRRKALFFVRSTKIGVDYIEKNGIRNL